MAKPRGRRRWCQPCRKDAYRDQVAAQIGMERIKNSGERRDKEPVRVYPCPYHNGWHMTSQPYDPRKRGSERR